MLIDTKQIIPVTELRLRLSEILADVAAGNTLYVSDRGKITVKLTPSETVEKEKRIKLLKEIEQLRKRNDAIYRKHKKVWNSVDVIRKMREERTKHLMQFWK